MPLPIPDVPTLADRNASLYEAAFPGCDARSPNRFLTVNSRVIAMASADEYLYLGSIAQELMPDTAQAWLPRHASIRGIPQDQQTSSAGTGAVSAAGSLTPVVIPVGFAFISPGGVIALVVAAVTIPAGGNAIVALQSSEAGSSNNVAGGAIMGAVSPLRGLNPQSCTLAANGLSGATDLESITSWRARILARWRQPAMGGAAADYVAWAEAALSTVAKVYVAPAQIAGLGNVGVTVAMAGPLAPTDAEIAIVNAAIQTARPVTSRVQVSGATLLPVAITLALNPNSTATQAAALAALQLFFAQDSQIGGNVVDLATGNVVAGYTLFMSRLDNAVSSSDGEYSHERIAPAADITPASGVLLTLGAVTFQ